MLFFNFMLFIFFMFKLSAQSNYGQEKKVIRVLSLKQPRERLFCEQDIDALREAVGNERKNLDNFFDEKNEKILNTFAKSFVKIIKNIKEFRNTLGDVLEQANGKGEQITKQLVGFVKRFVDLKIIPKKAQISQDYHNIDSIFDLENKKIAENYERFSGDVLNELSQLRGSQREKFNEILDSFFDETYRNVNYLLKGSNKNIFKSIQERINLIRKELNELASVLEKKMQLEKKLNWMRRLDLSKHVGKMIEYLKQEIENEERYFLKVAKFVNDEFEFKLDSFINHALFKSINKIEMDACEQSSSLKNKIQKAK